MTLERHLNSGRGTASKLIHILAEFLAKLLARHSTETAHIAWDNDSTHEKDEVEAVLRGAAGHLALLYLSTYSW